MDDVKLFSLILEKSRPADTWSWCVYIYISPPLHARYRLNRLVEEVKHRIFIWWKGKLTASEPSPICSCARGSAWLRYADCWLEKLTDGGEKSSSFSSFSFFLSLSFSLSIEVRYDTTWWVGFGGPQPAIWLSNRGLSVPRTPRPVSISRYRCVTGV